MTADNIKVNTQSSIRIEGSRGVVYADPFKIQNEPHDAAYILITHDHYDHFSPEDIRKVAKSETVLIVPEKMEKNARELGSVVGNIITVRPGEDKDAEGLGVETIPSYNNLKPFHPKSAGWVGYIIRLDDQRIYIAGDTDLTKEAKEVKCDIALVPIGGNFTMDAKKAAELINAIKPEIAIPTHYGSIVGSKEDADVFKSAVNADTEVVIKIS